MTKKRRVFRQVLEALREFQSSNRNPQLVVMSKTFDTYNSKLREMIIALQEQHSASAALNKARMKVTQ
jgi:hypothetical protein